MSIALAIVSHPDDAEFLCAGTLAHLSDRGWKVEMATVTAGDKGSNEYSRDEIARIRKAEAAKAANLINAGYHCLDFEDSVVLYDRSNISRATELVRQIKPILVITMSPSCYHIDHEMTSLIVRAATFNAGVPNFETGASQPLTYIPHLYYSDPMEGKDIFGETINPGTVVDITGVIEIKEQMLACHESQRNWLLEHHGLDQYLNQMKELSRNRGELIGVDYAEGFRQHLGHAYPQNDLLKESLGDLATKM